MTTRNKLEAFKKKHYKGLNDTTEIDALIHKAKINEKKTRFLKAEEDSVTLDNALKLKIQRARRYLVNERKKASPKAKSMMNATIVN